MKAYKVYLIENIVNGKVYVGWTSQSLKKRFYQHSRSEWPIGRAIKHHGVNSFTIKELDSFGDRESVLKSEIYWVDFYKANTYDAGYNCTRGGEDSPKERNADVYKTDKFKDKMRTKAFKQYADSSKKKTHVDGIRKYWDTLGESERLVRSSISISNGKKGGQPKGFKQGIPRPERQGIKHPYAKTYSITRPDGVIEIIKCLKSYCQNNNLTYRNAQAVVAGKQSHHKGYTFTRMEDTLS